VDLSGADLQLGSFEELALPLFDQPYKFACWLTHDRQEVEDLVRKPTLKPGKGSRLSIWELISGHGSIACCGTRS
jgi:hypothetical protein